MAAARFPAKTPAQGWRSYDGTRGFPPFFLFTATEEAARVPLLEASGWSSKGGGAGNGAGRRGGAPRYKKADKVASRGESRFSSSGKGLELRRSCVVGRVAEELRCGESC